MFNHEHIEDQAEILDGLSDFQVFLHDLARNLQSTPKVWDNDTLKDYLNGMAMFALGIKGYYQNNHPEIDPEQPTWRVFADILLAGRVYDSD